MLRTKSHPPGSNQNGEAHWPAIRIWMAHHPDRGLAVRPCWGLIYGGEAVSPQGFTEQTSERLPTGVVLMADCNFAMFQVTWAAQRHNFGVLFPGTEQRARRIVGQTHPWPGSNAASNGGSARMIYGRTPHCRPMPSCGADSS
jgi:hypothetical protein